MARPSKLSPQQWSDIERRLSAGEAPSDLAREFKVHPSQITRRVSQVSQIVRNVAQKVAEAQDALAALPPTQQYNALSLAEKLRGMSLSLASGAELGAKSFHRLNALANGELQKVDDANLLSDESVTAIKTVGFLTKVANECGAGAFNLLAANKDAVKRINEAEPEEEEITPERLADGARRMAFVLQRAVQESANG